MNNIFKFKCLCLIIFLYLILSSLCLAYDDKVTHPHVTRSAINESRLNAFMQEYFNLEGYIGDFGPDSLLNDKSVLKLVQEGSEKEDSPACRAANHFHNPIAPGAWDEGKLTDPHLLISIVACNTFFPEYPFESTTSNLTWATGFTSIDPAEKDSMVMERNEWDWASAREYFFTAATGLLFDEYYDTVIAVDEEQRNILLEDTLIAVGYIAHLLQDTSVPAHVRNDFSQGHTMLNYEAFKWPWKWIGNAYEKYLARNDKYIAAFNSSPIRAKQVNYRLTNFWDTNQFNEGFNGNNASMDSFGLAEYTNLNFLSEFTIFTPEFPFPNFKDVIIVKEKPHPLSIFNRQYYATTTNHPGEIIGHLAIASNLNHYIKKYTLPGMILEKFPVYMDSKCYDEYASHLIPRAVGFSADLIDYFFRGRIEIFPILPQDLVVRGDGSGEVSIFNITTTLRNATSDPDSQGNTIFANENMGEGSLYAIARYEVDGDVKYSLSRRIYVRASNNNLMSDTASVEYDFDFSKKPIPWNASNTAIQVVFRGTLGTEENIAVAVGRQPLMKMEVTPPSEYVYSVIDASEYYTAGEAQPQFFSSLKVSLRSELSGKEMQEGTLTAIAAYRELGNYEPDLYVEGLQKEYVPEVEDRLPDQSFSVSAPVHIPVDINSISSSSPTEVEFDFSNNQIPAGITDLYLYIVFEGTLRDTATGTIEPNSFVMGIKDLNEPSHIVYGNSTDEVIVNGVLTDAQTVKSTPEMAALADWDHNGIFNEINIVNGVNIGEPYIDPYSISLQFAFSPIDSGSFSPHKISIDSLPSGRYSKFIVLSEANPDLKDKFQVTTNLSRHYGSQIETDHFSYHFEGVISQINDSLLWDSTSLEPDYFHRGVFQNRLFGEFFCLGSPCPYLGVQRKIYDLTPYPITILP